MDYLRFNPRAQIHERVKVTSQFTTSGQTLMRTVTFSKDGTAATVGRLLRSLFLVRPLSAGIESSSDLAVPEEALAFVLGLQGSIDTYYLAPHTEYTRVSVVV